MKLYSNFVLSPTEFQENLLLRDIQAKNLVKSLAGGKKRDCKVVNEFVNASYVHHIASVGKESFSLQGRFHFKVDMEIPCRAVAF